MPYTQTNRLISINTPLGKDALLLQNFTGHEAISQPFSFTLDLLSEDSAIAFDKIVGQRVTLSVSLPDDKERHFDGFVSRFAQTGQDKRFYHYRAEMVPWLWFLTRTADCRIFQKMTIPDIITKVFKDLGFSDFKLQLQGFQPREYCVQYRETDFNFVSRLMEQYGIFYFFEHEQGKHTMVLANSASAHKPCSPQSKVRYDITRGGPEEEDAIHSFRIEQELRPGKYALTDYNFSTPSTSLSAKVDSTVKVGSNGKYEIYDYPGEYLKKDEGDDFVKIRMQEEEAFHLVVHGTSNCRSFTTGYRFDLEEHYRSDLNTTYVLTEVQHVGSSGDSYFSTEGSKAAPGYSNQFTCTPHKIPFRPARVTPKPTVQGVQTAVVVGVKGEEIYTDKYGQVKVQFHWDREGKKDENSSCWIRVAHSWAGKRWGHIFIPRIGQEVIVDFIEGDPDQPIITGSVYNAEQMPPYALPANQTQSGIKTRSSKGGGEANFNEIRFEDKKGSEELYIHAEKDQTIVVENDKNQTVGHDETLGVGNNRTKKVGVDQSETIGANKTIKVGANHTETIDANKTLSVGANHTETIGGNMSLSVSGNETETVKLAKAESIILAKTLTIGAAYQVSVGAAMNETIVGAKAEEIGAIKSVNVGANSSENVKVNKSVDAGGDISESAKKNVSISSGQKMALTAKDDFTITGSKNGVISIKDKLTIKCGKATIVMKENGDIIVNGNKINIKGDGDITIKSSGKILQN